MATVVEIEAALRELQDAGVRSKPFRDVFHRALEAAETCEIEVVLEEILVAGSEILAMLRQIDEIEAREQSSLRSSLRTDTSTARHRALQLQGATKAILEILSNNQCKFG